MYIVHPILFRSLSSWTRSTFFQDRWSFHSHSNKRSTIFRSGIDGKNIGPATLIDEFLEIPRTTVSLSRVVAKLAARAGIRVHERVYRVDHSKSSTIRNRDVDFLFSYSFFVRMIRCLVPRARWWDGNFDCELPVCLFATDWAVRGY